MLCSSESDYEDPEEHAPMGFMAAGGGFHDGNASADKTNRETAEEAIRKATGKVNTPLECWGCNNSPIYHADRFHIYRNFPNKMDPDEEECENMSIQEYTQSN